jgi:hypothetical protein
MCDWNLVDSEGAGIPCPQTGDPALNDVDAAALGNNLAIYCRPGDLKYAPTDNNNKDLCRPAQSAGCPGLTLNQVPYTIDGQKISCNCDDDCNTNGVGGNCFLDPATPGGAPLPIPSTNTCEDTLSNAYCYPPVGSYNEWREGYTAFNGAPQEDACVQTFASSKQWCEMPWTHPTVVGSDGKTADPPCWKTQYKQPYYYRQEDGKCYITKSYCENNVGAGGFDSSFGDGTEYLEFSTCSTPQGDTNEIQKGYDCCTSLSSSIAQFFFGKSIPAEFDNLVNYATEAFSGNSPTSYCSGGASSVSESNATSASASPSASASASKKVNELLDNRDSLAPLISFLSDERLKENIQLLEEDACGLGLHSYTYTWNNVAKRLYKKPDGVMTGLLIKDLEKVFPQCIRTTPYGHKVFAHVPALMPQLPDIMSIVYLCVIAVLMGSSDVTSE